jgi:aminopeptidase N
MTEPMVTYLAFFAAGRFRLEQGVVDGRPYVYAVSRRLSAGDQQRSLRLLEQTGDVVSWLQGKFGSYPFREVGGVISGLPVDYALETQTRPVYGYAGGPGPSSLSLLVHENAHQWFGDDVSLRHWRDVWLNEGFATYAEWLYAQEHGGPSLRDHLRREYDGRPADAGFWKLRIDDPGPADMWNNPVYVRGAMTLAALGQRVGDSAVLTMLRDWTHRRQFGHGTDRAFRHLAERVTGQDLQAFFRHWLDGTRKPADTTANGLGS